MRRILIAGLGITALITAVPLMKSHIWSAASAENIQQPPQIHLNMDAQKQVLLHDEQGKETVSWKSLQYNAVVNPGDVLRYTITGENYSDRPVKNLTINEPIPQQMAYVLKSTAVNSNTETKVSYSIDGGRTYSENPTIKVKLANGKEETQPAPATAYTNIRLNVSLVAAKTTVKASYQTQVR